MSAILGTYRHLDRGELQALTHLAPLARWPRADASLIEHLHAIAIQPLTPPDQRETLLVWARHPRVGWQLVWWHQPTPQRLDPKLARALRTHLNETMTDSSPEAFELGLADALMAPDDGLD